MSRGPKRKPDVADPLTNDELTEFLSTWNGFIWKKVQTWKRAYPEFDVEDLHAAAMFGVVEARRLYDRTSGKQFSTYAAYHMDNRLLKYAKEEAKRGMHIPGMKKLTFASIASIEAMSGHGDERHWEPEQMPNAGVRVFPDDWWERVLRGLAWRDGMVLYLRYAEGWGLKDCARAFGISRERVRQISKSAAEWLRENKADLLAEVA